MINWEREGRKILAGLPQDHPERAAMTSWLDALADRNRLARKDGSSFVSSLESKMTRRGVLAPWESSYQDFEKTCEKRGILLSDNAKFILRGIDSEVGNEGKVEYGALAVRDLGFDSAPTTREFAKKVTEIPILDELPLRASSQYRLDYSSQPLGEWQFAWMKPVTGVDGNPDVLAFGRNEDGLWMISDWASPGLRWILDNQVVFRLRK